MEIEIKGLRFIQTCDCYPEQYDVVYTTNGELVGYVRLRDNRLTCNYPHVGGKRIYAFNYGDNEHVGCFENDYDRMYHLEIIADLILRSIKENPFTGEYKGPTSGEVMSSGTEIVSESFTDHEGDFVFIKIIKCICPLCFFCYCLALT